MKEKRYFCDWFSEKKTKVWYIILFVMTIFMTIASFCFLVVAENRAYSEERYQEIEECIDYFLNGNELNLSNEESNPQIGLPENMAIDVRKTDEGTLLTAYYEDGLSFPNLSIRVNLSSKEKEKIRNFNSLDEFKENNMFKTIPLALILGIGLSILIAFITTLILELFSFISEIKKNKELGIEEEEFQCCDIDH